MATKQDIKDFATVIMAAKTQEIGGDFFSYLDNAADAFIIRYAGKDGKIDPQELQEFLAIARKDFLETLVPGVLGCAMKSVGGPYEGQDLREYFQEFFNSVAKVLGSMTPDFSFIVHVATNDKQPGQGTVQDP